MAILAGFTGGASVPGFGIKVATWQASTNFGMRDITGEGDAGYLDGLTTNAGVAFSIEGELLDAAGDPMRGFTSNITIADFNGHIKSGNITINVLPRFVPHFGDGGWQMVMPANCYASFSCIAEVTDDAPFSLNAFDDPFDGSECEKAVVFTISTGNTLSFTANVQATVLEWGAVGDKHLVMFSGRSQGVLSPAWAGTDAFPHASLAATFGHMQWAITDVVLSQEDLFTLTFDACMTTVSIDIAEEDDIHHATIAGLSNGQVVPSWDVGA